VNRDFDSREKVILPVSATEEVGAIKRTQARVMSQRFTRERVELEIEAPAPSVVVVAQTYYHNWHVYVNGHEKPLLRGNYAYQAFEVDGATGVQKAELRYEDQAFRVGLWITSLAGLGCLVWYARAGRLNSTRHPGAA